MRAQSASRSIVRPTSSVGWRVSAVHSWDGRRAGGGGSPSVEQLERADDALARRRARCRRGPGARRVSSPCSAAGPRAASCAGQRARTRGRRRAQLEVGQRGAQVEAGAADHDRAPPGGEEPVDLGVREPRVLAGAETCRRRARTPTSRCSSRARSCGSPRRSGSRGPRRPAARRPRPRPVLPAARSRSASASATSVLPTPVGPKIAITRHAARAEYAGALSSTACRVRIGTGLSTSARTRAAGARRGRAPTRAAASAARPATSRSCSRPARTCRARRDARGRSTRRSRRELIGCGAGGVIGATRARSRTAPRSSVWAASLGDGEAPRVPRRVEELEDGTGALSGHARPRRRRRRDPARRPAQLPDRRRAALPRRGVAPAVPLLGGLASARGARRRHRAVPRRRACIDDGAVGVRLDGVEMLPCVSQGAAPIGPELTITAPTATSSPSSPASPALTKLREAIEALDADDRELVHGGLLLGIVVDPNKPDYVQGDFLVRGLRRRRPGHRPASRSAPTCGRARSSACTRATPRQRRPRPARGARRAHGGARRPPPAGALLFACNGRGAGMFGVPDHDAEAVADALARRAGGRLLRGRRDRAGRRRVLPARLHGHGGGLRAVNLGGARRVAAHRARPAASAMAIARALAARGARLVLTGRRADVLEPLAAEVGGRASSCDLAEPRRPSGSLARGRRRRRARRQRRAARPAAR